jgi:hypothetical protein
MFVHSKVMFEIYREAGFDRRYRAVFFTELDEHNRDQEIGRAAAGEHYCGGFLRERDLPAAKAVIAHLLERLNEGQAVDPQEVAAQLIDYSTDVIEH